MHGLKISFEIIAGDITGISGAKFIANVILCFQVITGYYAIFYHACTCRIVSIKFNVIMYGINTSTR